MSKRCQKGAQKAHFLEPKASFLGAKFARVALCESIIIYYVLITLSHQKSMRERTKNRCGNAMCARDAFFPSFICTLCVKVLPKVAPRAPKGSERESKSLPRDTSKSWKNRPGGLGGSGGALGKENDPKINEKTTNFDVLYYILYTIYYILNASKNDKISLKICESEGRVENWRAFRHVFQDLSSSTLQAEYEIMLENSRAFRHVFQEFSNYTLQAEYEIMPENSRAFRHVFQEFSKYTLQAEYEIMSENSRAFRHAFQRLAK